jgi:hypothetical protein
MHQQLFKRLTLVLFFQIILFSQLRAQDSLIIRQFFNDILTRGKCYSTLDYLSNKIGGRLSGSVQAEQAVQYMYATMKQYTFDTVWLQPVMVPHWERGEKEIGYYLTNGKKIKVDIWVIRWQRIKQAQQQQLLKLQIWINCMSMVKPECLRARLFFLTAQ